MNARKKFKAMLIALVVLYALVFAARLVYNLVAYEDLIVEDSYYYLNVDDSMRFASNVASLRQEFRIHSGQVEYLDQKYERVASVSTKTVSYDSDVARLDAAIEQSQAVVQRENVQGIAGSRRLSRAIGVKPEYFGDCLADIQEIGALVSSTSQITDKTYEYRQMLAQKQELEKRIESYQALRSHGGSINELLSLEDKIIEVESQLLQQSVDLGEYSDDNSLCTINVSLYEGSPVSIAYKTWDAFVWTNKCYFAILAGLSLVCIAAVILVYAYVLVLKASTIIKKPKE